MLERLGFFVFRNRWLVIGVWLALFAGSAIVAPHVTSVLKGGGYSTPSSESDRADQAVEKVYGHRTLVFTSVFSGPHRAAEQSAQAFRSRLRRRMGRIFDPSPVTFSPDGVVAFVRIYSRPRADYGIPLTASVRNLLPRSRGVQAYVTGAPATFYDMEQASDDDLRRMEIITFPIALIILLIIFGTLVGAFVPVSMGPLTVASALASVFVLGHFLDMSIFVLNTVSMLGLGVAIDYSLFMVQRFREELALSGSVESAVVVTASRAGRAILVSALTVAIGFLGMVTFNVPMLTSLGVGGSVVVAISLLAALTLLPALLSVLGFRVNSLSVLPARLSSERFWKALAGFVMKRPCPVVAFVALTATILALPALHLRVGVPGVDILPVSAQSRAGDAILQKHIGVANAPPVLVVVRSRPAAVNRERPNLQALLRRACSQRDLAGIGVRPVIDSPSQITPCATVLAGLSVADARTIGRSTIVLPFYLTVDPSSAQAESFVNLIRAFRQAPGISVQVGGQTAAQIDFDNYVYGRFPLAILLVVGSILVILAVAFRSVLLPVKAVLMNGFSILAAYGAAVFVFQDGHLRQLLGFTPTGSLDSVVPVFLFCVLFGLSTDYEVFLLMRAREEFLANGNNTQSVSIALQRTGKMITSAALIMVVIFTAFAFANLVVIKELGLALAVGVAVDATLIRALMVPAMMRIFGRWNWWPGVRIGASTGKPALTSGTGVAAE